MPETSGKAEGKKQDRNYNVRVENATLPQQNIKWVVKLYNFTPSPKKKNPGFDSR